MVHAGRGGALLRQGVGKGDDDYDDDELMMMS